MREHVRLLGILNIVMGCLVALVGVVVLVALGGVAGLIGAHAHNIDDTRVAPILALIGLCVAFFFLLLAAPSIIGGWGLLNFRPWARILIIIVSILHLLSFPLGTALGIYGIWVLLGDQGRRLFEAQGAGYYPPPPYPPQAAQPSNYPPQPPGA